MLSFKIGFQDENSATQQENFQNVSTEPFSKLLSLLCKCGNSTLAMLEV